MISFIIYRNGNNRHLLQITTGEYISICIDLEYAHSVFSNNKILGILSHSTDLTDTNEYILTFEPRENKIYETFIIFGNNQGSVANFIEEICLEDLLEYTRI